MATDYFRGQMDGISQQAGFAAVAARRADREADASIASWMNYAASLKDRLEASEAKLAAAEAEVVKSCAGWHGSAAVGEALRAGLREVAPNHPLLAQGALSTTRTAAAAKLASSQGFDYDAATGDVRRRR
ncbi:MAG: hypothetical protein EPN79_15825 [Burkholderiaceae bacterium]|nr:MAG: hypothetical protein EPN79_15825 [Burkholderiaceae bacterium]